MHEKVNEQVEVSVAFLKNKVIPRKFMWNGRVYEIKRLSMVHERTSGHEKVYYFFVSDGVNFFRLSFATADLTWVLEEMYVE